VLKFLLEAVWVDYGSLWKKSSRIGSNEIMWS